MYIHVCIHVYTCASRYERSATAAMVSATFCNPLQSTATHCNTLQHKATGCNRLQQTHLRIALRAIDNSSNNVCITLQQTATHCNPLQSTATYCNTLQHTATHCNTLQHTAIHSTHHNTLQHTATNIHLRITLRTIGASSNEHTHHPRVRFLCSQVQWRGRSCVSEVHTRPRLYQCL